MQKLTFTYAGDSITDPDNSWSWTRFVSEVDPDLSVHPDGGVGISGATSAAIAAKVEPIHANVLVMLLGTNDVRLEKSRASTLDNLQSIATTVGASHTVLVATPPCSLTAYKTTDDGSVINRATLGYALNRDLNELAEQEGWLFVDPWAGVRRMDNTWAPGAARPDDVHPTADTGASAGHKMATYIRQAVEGSRP